MINSRAALQTSVDRRNVRKVENDWAKMDPTRLPGDEQPTLHRHAVQWPKEIWHEGVRFNASMGVVTYFFSMAAMRCTQQHRKLEDGD